MRNYQIVSDISILLVLAPKLEQEMTTEMQEKFTEILRGELTAMNVYLLSAVFEESHHLFKLVTPPQVSPLTAVDIVMEAVTPRFIQCFEELKGWGSIYHDRVFIKTGEEISDQQLSDLLSFSLSDI
ncbi:MAG: hypothetical protein OEZ32_14065 [Nitrospinota bacterium]|nr:hypothetical protein [Nitrospinota bacterium]